MWSIEVLSGTTPAVEIAPNVPLKPTMPQYAAGIRTDPPLSVPMLIGTIPAATAAADPELDPPVALVRSCGLWTGPRTGWWAR